jgi:hypothetical protein
MPSGPLPPNPPELLASKAMERFFQGLVQSRAEAIIFDTPPLLELSDTCIFASKVDGTLLVTDIIKPARKTPGFRHGDMSAVPFSGLGQRGHCSHLTLYRIYAIM